MPDLRTQSSRLCSLVAELGLHRHCDSFYLASGYASVTLTPTGFVRLVTTYKVKEFKAERNGEFINATCKFRNCKWTVSVWSRSPDETKAWQVINSLTQPTLEVDRPRLSIKQTAIEDKRRLIGLPAPKIVEVIDAR